MFFRAARRKPAAGSEYGGMEVDRRLTPRGSGRLGPINPKKKTTATHVAVVFLFDPSADQLTR